MGHLQCGNSIVHCVRTVQQQGIALGNVIAAMLCCKYEYEALPRPMAALIFPPCIVRSRSKLHQALPKRLPVTVSGSCHLSLPTFVVSSTSKRVDQVLPNT